MGAIGYEVLDEYGTVGERKKESLELKKVMWGDREAKYDLRWWDKESGQPHKGVTMSKEEVKELGKIIQILLTED